MLPNTNLPGDRFEAAFFFFSTSAWLVRLFVANFLEFLFSIWEIYPRGLISLAVLRLFLTGLVSIKDLDLLCFVIILDVAFALLFRIVPCSIVGL